MRGHALMVALVLATAASFGAALGPGAAVASADDGRLTVEGRIVDERGEPIAAVATVLAFEGRRPVPPFFADIWKGRELRFLHRAAVDETGRFTLPRCRADRIHTVLVGDSGMVLFGVAAVRHVRFREGREVVIALRSAEERTLLELPDRVGDFEDGLDRVVFDLDLALGWLAEARRRLEERLAPGRFDRRRPEARDPDPDERPERSVRAARSDRPSRSPRSEARKPPRRL